MTRRVKLIFNPFANVGHAWREIQALRLVAADFEGVDWAGTVFPEHADNLACNGGREGGGFLVSPGTRLDDNQLEFAAVRRLNRLTMLRTIPYFLRGTHARLPYIRTGVFKQLELTSDRPLVIHADGEIIAGLSSTTRKIAMQVVPAALQVIRPGA